jgi:hypothetical protein
VHQGGPLDSGFGFALGSVARIVQQAAPDRAQRLFPDQTGQGVQIDSQAPADLEKPAPEIGPGGVGFGEILSARQIDRNGPA